MALKRIRVTTRKRAKEKRRKQNDQHKNSAQFFLRDLSMTNALKKTADGLNKHSWIHFSSSATSALVMWPKAWIVLAGQIYCQHDGKEFKKLIIKLHYKKKSVVLTASECLCWSEPTEFHTEYLDVTLGSRLIKWMLNMCTIMLLSLIYSTQKCSTSGYFDWTNTFL